MKTRNTICHLIASGIIIVFLVSCTLISSGRYRDLSATHLLFPNQKMPGAIRSISWPNGDWLTMETFGISHQPMFIGNISTRVLNAITLDGEVISGDSPKISPDGKYIAFNIYANQPQGNKVSIAKFGQDVVSDPKSGNVFISEVGDLAWSPDSQHLAILRRMEKGIVLFIYSLSGQNLQKVFESSVGEIWNLGSSLSWSSDGKVLAFALAFDTGDFIESDIYILNLENNQLTRVTNTLNFDENYPSWYPKGMILTYALTPAKGSRLLDSKLVFVTQDGLCTKVFNEFSGIENPSWSPDGTQMIFLSEDGIQVFDVADVIPPEYLSPDFLCTKDN